MQRPVLHLDDPGAEAVEDVPVVADQQQRPAAGEPLNAALHPLGVEVRGRLVGEGEEGVPLHRGQPQPGQLPAAQTRAGKLARKPQLPRRAGIRLLRPVPELFEVADRSVADDAPLVGRKLPRQDGKQGRLARPVGADDADPVPFEDGKLRKGKNLPVAEKFHDMARGKQ